MSFVIRPAQIQDLEQILPIYNAEILYGTSTWNSTPKTIQDFQNMLSELNAQGFPLLVAEHLVSKQIAGYADYSTFRPIQGFKHTVEHSVFLHAFCRACSISLSIKVLPRPCPIKSA